MAVLKNILLTTQITALKVKDEHVFIGEGQFLHIHNLNNGNRLVTHQVFEAAVVHGIQIQLDQNEEGNHLILAVWGQKSFSNLQYKLANNELDVLMKERHFEDWIIDAALESDSSHLIIATAHNSLIRYKLHHITEYHEAVEEVSKNFESLLNSEKSKELTWINTRWKAEENVVSKTYCSENCILYCGCIVLIGGNWESAVLLAGTVFSQILIWGPWCPKDGKGRVMPIHQLSGHEGVLFSINFSAAQNLITTTSDDRSLRMWSITGELPQVPSSNTKQAQQCWLNAKITEKHICYGHGARVWQSLLLSSCIVSVGEDSKVCVWDHQGRLVNSWKAHDGACVWKVAASHDESRLVTGGGDGSVKTWSLNANDSQKAEPLLGGPWCDEDETLTSGDKDKQETELQFHTEKETEILDCELNWEGEAGENLNGKKCQSNKTKAPDFPRCITMAGINNYLIAMDSGRLFQWNSVLSSWSLLWEDTRMKNYVIMETSSDLKNLAIGMLCGVVLILTNNDGHWVKLTEANLCKGKVFSLFWLGNANLLTCGPDGAISIWRHLESEGVMGIERNHLLPMCKQRWVSAACVFWISKIQPYSIICGDRAGSLHLYHHETVNPKHTLRGIHGKNGVTSLITHEGLVYSSGRDGCVRCIKLSETGMQILTVTRVSNVSWVAQVMFLQGRPMAVCFHDIYLKLWSLEEDRTVAEVKCGGGHRSWALQTSKLKDELVFFFLKDGMPYIFRTKLADKLMPLLKTPVNTRETMCLQPLFHAEGETVFVTGGEDTTIRIHSIQGLERHRSFCVVRSHISNIRALCRIETEGANILDRAVWFVSAGGRAQMKIWKVTTNENKENYQESENESSEKVQKQLSTVSCREVTSHMIRTGSSKTWKSQELTFDPETRYMDSAAFWISEQKAIIVLASSDGVLRVYQFCQQMEKLTLVCSEVCNHCLLKVKRVPVKGRYILVSAGTDGTIIFWDLQPVINWVHNFDVTANSSPPTLRIRQQTSIQTHQSGVNSLSFNVNMDSAVDEQTRDITDLLLATGGDDNKLCVWHIKVNTSDSSCAKIEASFVCDVNAHASQITGLEWVSKKRLISSSIDQRVIVWDLCWNHICDNIQEPRIRAEHSSWTGDEFSAVTTSKPVLRVLSSGYSGVPDIKGLAVASLKDILNENQDFLQRIFLYGNGLQVYDLH